MTGITTVLISSSTLLMCCISLMVTVSLSVCLLFQTHDWHHNSINKFKHAPYVLHQPHGDYKNVHPGHPYENRLEATVTGEVGKGLAPLPSKESWKKPSKEFAKLPTWDNKDEDSGDAKSQLTSNIQQNNDTDAILLKSSRPDIKNNETAASQMKKPDVRVIEIRVRGRHIPPWLLQANPPASPLNPPAPTLESLAPSKESIPESSPENVTTTPVANATASTPTIHLANFTAEPPSTPLENATESSTANAVGGIPPLAATAAANNPSTGNATTLAGIPPLAPVTGVSPPSAGAVENAKEGTPASAVGNSAGNSTASSPSSLTSNVINEKSTSSKNGAHKRSKVQRKGVKRSKQTKHSKGHRRHSIRGRHHHPSQGIAIPGSRRSHIHHTPVMQVLKDFSYKITHLGQRAGDDDENHLSPAEIII